MKKSINKKISILSIIVLLFSAFAPLFIGVSSAQAANFTQAYLRYDRMKASTATNVLVVITPVTVGTEAKIKVTFAAGTSVAATGAGLTVGTANLPTGVDGVPGTLTVASSGQDVTISGVTDLTVGSDYGVNITAGITNGTAGAREDTITTQTSAPATIDTSNVGTRAITDDQIVLLATVPPTFNFVLSGVTDTFGDLNPAAVVSTAGKTVTVSTNADKGWIAWVKSANAALSSTTTGETIDTTGTVGSGGDSLLTAGTNGYVLDVDATTQGAGTGTMTIDAEYDGTTTSRGGTLSSTVLQPIASAAGTTDGDVMTLIARATISAVKGAADDYTDTLTVVGAGNF